MVFLHLYMKALNYKSSIVLQDLQHFDLKATLECGQAFRWQARPDGSFVGVVGRRMVHAKQKGNALRLWPMDMQRFEGYWKRYFALDQDYAAMLSGVPKDPFLQRCLEGCHGLRVLNQPPFETLISFILSANNNVARIRGIIERLCRRFGKRLRGGGEYYAFPEPQALAGASVEDLQAIGAGYRAPYVIGSAQSVAAGFDLEALRALPYPMAKQALRTLPGVGPKVADCVLLFSLGHTCAFVQDVWIKRVMQRVYGESERRAVERFALERFGNYGGIVQQYLFHYARTEGKRYLSESAECDNLETKHMDS